MTSETVDSFNKLMYKQHQTMTLIANSLANYKKMGQAKLTHAVTKHRVELLHHYFATAQDLDADLNCAADDDIREKHPYFTERQFATCAILYEEALDYLHEVIATFSAQSVTASAANASFQFSARSLSHLPRLELPTFDGSYSNWETFRDRFQSMIVVDNYLSNVEKMHYLCSVLSGDASNAV